MRDVSRYGSCIALACALVLAASAAPAEERKAGRPRRRAGRAAAKATKWFVPEMDSDQSGMAKAGSKTSPIRPGKH